MALEVYCHHPNDARRRFKVSGQIRLEGSNQGEEFNDESYYQNSSVYDRGRAMSVGTLAACGSSDSGSDAKGKVYYLNYKPEINDAWKALAKKYTEKTGVEVKVETAASGTYQQTLKSEFAKSEAPTLFQLSGVAEYQTWKVFMVK